MFGDKEITSRIATSKVVKKTILKFNKNKLDQWFKNLPGALIDIGKTPTIVRDRDTGLLKIILFQD
jgi:hypothetical protein